jgi:hypothetical protein
MSLFLHDRAQRSHLLLLIALLLCLIPSLNAQPDLMVVEDVMKNTISYRKVNLNDPCYIQEKCIGGLGEREVLTFTTEIRNIGNVDFFIGKAPTDPLATSTQFVWDGCHRHWHYKAYAKYGLYDANGTELPTSFKNGFCVSDLGRFLPNGVPKYTCDYQGISVACYDKYDNNLPCQWIDITGVPAGIYKLVVDVNWLKQKDNNGKDESNYNNNTATVHFKVERNNGTTVVTVVNGPIVPPSVTGMVTVYENNDYAGKASNFNQGTFNSTDLGGLNLKISSLLVMNGYQVRACRADGYCRTFTANTAFVGTDMTDQIVSLEVSPKVTIPTCNLVATATQTPATCANNDGKVTIIATGGTLPYQVSLDENATFSSTLSFGGLLPGAHYVTVKDNKGCIERVNFTVTKACTPPPTNCSSMIVYVNTIPTTCAGNDGIISETVLGGTPPYVFSIDSKDSQKIPSFTGLSTGAHYATVKDAVGCTVVKNFTITRNCVNPIVCAITINTQTTNVTCTGNDGKMTATITGGSAPYTYTVDTKAAQSSNIFTGLTEGKHTLIVKDNAGCTQTVSFTNTKTCTTTPNCNNILTYMSPLPATCAGNDGVLTKLVLGGTAPYQFSVDGLAVQTNPYFEGLTVGAHYLTVKDNAGCSVRKDFTITKNCTTTPSCSLVINTQTTSITCAGGDGKMTATVTGGIAPYTYTVDTKTAQTSNGFTALAEGKHTLLVKDNVGCTQSVSFTNGKNCVTPPPTNCPSLIISMSPTPTSCAGNDGSLDKIVLGGTAPYQFSVDGLISQATPSFTGLTQGAHYITVKDNIGCTTRKDFTITKNCNTTPNCTLSATTQSTNTTCAGNDGKATVTLIGGTAPFTYAVDGKAAQTSSTFTALTEGTHLLTVKDNVGCARIVSFNIGKTCSTAPCAITIFSQLTAATCASNDGKGTFYASNGVMPYEYNIDGKAWQISNSFTALATGTHAIWVKDKVGCTHTFNFVTVKNCTVREDSKADILVNIFPNPSKREINIRMDEAFAERLTAVRVYDLLGNIVVQTDARSQEISFEIMRDGIYMVVLHAKEGSTVTKRVVISDKAE